MTKVAVSMFVLLLSAAMLGAAPDEPPHKSKDAASKAHADSPTPEVRILSPADGAVIKGNEIPVQIETRNFEFAYNKATKPGTMTTLPDKYASVPQEPNSGHVHVYLARYPREGATGTEKFFMVKSFTMPNQASFVLNDVSPGRYRLLVELVRHDHGPRVKHHPIDWPPLDMVSVTVE